MPLLGVIPFALLSVLLKQSTFGAPRLPPLKVQSSPQGWHYKEECFNRELVSTVAVIVWGLDCEGSKVRKDYSVNRGEARGLMEESYKEMLLEEVVTVESLEGVVMSQLKAGGGKQLQTGASLQL